MPREIQKMAFAVLIFIEGFGLSPMKVNKKSFVFGYENHTNGGFKHLSIKLKPLKYAYLKIFLPNTFW